MRHSPSYYRPVRQRAPQPVRVRRARLDRLAGATYQQRRGQNRHVIKQSLRGTGARLFVAGWRDAVPMLLGEEGIA